LTRPNLFFNSFADNYLIYILFFLGLVLLKVIASSSTNGAGGVGGIFAPTLFIGGVTGFIVASLLNRYTGIDLPDNRLVLVGMAGAMTGVMHAPLTAIFLIAEITGGYSLRKTDAWNLPVLDKGFYVGFLSKSRVYATYRELLIQVSEE
jgi:CIC family chloride channel protein